MYVVGKGKVLCDALHEFKLLDCLNTPEKCNDIFRERERSTFAMNSYNQIPLSVTQVFTLLGL
jgi:hypothetical protein